MMRIVFIGMGAGAASALLFASIVSGSPLSFLLANFAQLPIMIAAIGWTHLAGLTAVLVASAGLAIVLGNWIAFAFLIGIALPAWWIGYLALLARPSPGPGPVGPSPVGPGPVDPGPVGPGPFSPGPAGIEWYPLGRIVVWTAIIAGCVVVVSMMRYGLDAAQMQAGLRRELERALRFLAGAPTDGPLALPGVKDADRLLDLLTLIVPPMKATALTATTLLNLWLAALAVKISGGLRRPWPAIAEMSFPPFAATVLAIAVAATFLPDLIGLIGGLFTASLLLAYALLGFAVLHAVTARAKGRGFMLTGLYLTVGLFGWPIVLMSMLGLIETMVALRARFAIRRGPPPPPTSIHRP